MLIFDDVFTWQGFGGVYQLGAGKCRLRIFDLQPGEHHKVTPIKSMAVVVSDLPDDVPKMKSVSVRSCASHIATSIVTRFKIDPHRMHYVEYYPSSCYGDKNQFSIPAKYDAVDFIWHDRKALHPSWRALSMPLAQIIADLIAETETTAKTDG
jgi:hypothetical protein